MRERRSAVPVLRDVQLARGLAAPRNPQPRRHHGPRHLLPPPRQELFAQRIQPQRLPQPPAQPYPAKGATPLHADPVQPHLRRRFPLRRRLEQLPLIPSPRDLSRQGLRPGAPLGVQLAELRHRLLHHLAVAPHRADEAPVDVRLAVLAANGVPQIHGHSPPHRRFSQIRLASCKGEGRHYTGFPEPAHTNPRTYRSGSLESALTFSEAEEVGLASLPRSGSPRCRQPPSVPRPLRSLRGETPPGSWGPPPRGILPVDPWPRYLPPRRPHPRAHDVHDTPGPHLPRARRFPDVLPGR